MDPNEAHRAMMAMVEQIHELADERGAVEEVAKNYCAEMTDLENLANELADQVHALDQWIQGGGFLPKAWQQGRAP